MESSNLTLTEALDMFPEVREELPQILKELKASQTEMALSISNLKKICLDLADKYWKEKKYADSIRVEGYYIGSPAHERFKRLSYHIKHIEAVLSGNKDFLSKEEIRHANEFPMRSVLNTKRDFHRCPFHNEKTASFHITGNKWYCHGCATGGTTIGFVMKKYNLPFKEAVRAINTYNL